MDVADPKISKSDSIYWLGIGLVILTVISSIYFSYFSRKSEINQLKQEVQNTAAIIATPSKFDEYLKIFRENYGIAIYQNNVLIASADTPVVDPTYTLEKVLRFHNDEWKFDVWPNANLIHSRITLLPIVLLFSGLLFSLLMLMLLYFYHRLRITALHMIKANREIERVAIRTRKILDTINEGFITTDENRCIVYINPYAEQMLNWRPEEVLGKDIHELLIPLRNRQKHKDSFYQFMTTGLSDLMNRETEFIVMDKNGREFPVEAVILPVKIYNHYEFHILIRDISARKKAETDQARLVSIIDSTNDAIISADIHGNILTWNKGAERMFGYTANEIIGRHINTIYPENIKTDFQQLMDHILRGEHVQVNDTIRQRKDGRIIPVSVHISPIKNKEGMVIGGSSITRDISESKKVETMKNEFVSIISHELRTPLNAISSSIGILASEKVCSLPNKAKQLLEIADNNCDRLIRLVNDILDMEKIEADKMDFKFKRLQLNKLVEEGINTNQSLAIKQNIVIEFCSDEIFYVWADQDKLKQVITNLLSNAIRHSFANSTVQVSLTNLIEKVRVSVIDHGPGVPKAFRDRIFGKFTQADFSAIRKTGGTGLGLSISKAIVEKHRGKMSFLSTEGKGSTFYFDLPLEEEKLASTPTYYKDKAFSKQTKDSKKIFQILNIDADIDVTHTISILLQNKASVWNVNSIAKAKKLLQEHEFDLIILDLILPDGYGTDLLPIVNYKTKQPIPVIIFSVDELDKKYLSLVNRALLKSIATNEELNEAIETAIQSGITARA